MPYNPKSLNNLSKATPFTPGPNGTGAAAARKGGLASQKVQRRKRTLVELASKIADADIKSKDVRDDLKRMGLDDPDLTNAAMIVAGVFQEATQGNLGAVEKMEAWQEKANLAAGLIDGDQKEFLLPAKLLGSSFVDLNREITTNNTWVIEGGRGSLKSSYISLKIIEIMRNNPEVNVAIIRKIQATLRDSVYEQMQWAISALGLEERYRCTVSPMLIVDKQTNQRIYFRGLDDPTKIKSIKPKIGYIGVLWVEEADQLNGPEELRNVRQSVLRGGDGLTLLSYNPPKSRMAWVNQYVLEPAENKHVHHSDYRTAPPEWLGPAFLEEAEHLKETNPTAYEHEYLGKAIGDGANVFDNLEIRTITDEEVAACDHIYQGVDWGFSPDPFAFIRLNYDHHREEILLIDEIYALKKQNRETAEMIKQRGYNDYPITCDSAEKKSTADFRALGLDARNAIKGPDSVRYGLKWLAGRKIIIDPKRTPHAYKEFTSYEHERDKDGNPISGYPDKNNHFLDGTRYSLESVWRKYYSKA